MNGAAGPISKWTAARGAIDRVTQAYDGSVELGLATFPHPDACGPGRIAVAPALGTGDEIAAALVAPPPAAGAYTPLGETLLALADESALVSAAGPAHVVVISDGFQWCSPYDPDARTLPIDGTRALTAEGVSTFVVGFGAGVDVETLDQMALVAGTARPGCDPSADGAAARCYYQADDAAALLAALMDIAAVTAAETCDGMDNDCDSTVDEGVCTTPAVDAGTPTTADADLDVVPAVPGGCGCAAGGPSVVSGPGALGLAGVLILLVTVLSWRRRDPRAARRQAGPRHDRARR